VSKPLVAGIALTVFLAGASGANKSLRTASGDRAGFAAQYDSEGVHMSVAGLQNKILVIETDPPDTAECSLTLDVVSRDQTFIADVASRGFGKISCIAYDENSHIVSSETRDIIPRIPPTELGIT
jgi:hypothetical protein